MAHGLRYYKELTHADGKVVRLELLQKDYAGVSMEIGPVCQSLRLDIQGDTEIDAPIVKTSLSMTFVDAPDHVDALTKKCGNWAEFYTNDATYWQVVVKAKNAGETAFRNVWGGYVTPDSYNEVLVYRGSVTIVARDNIGHLSDFPFDAVGNADGMISLIELIREAWDKIESPMWLDDQAVANADWLMSEGAYAYDTYMNVSAFESKNWYDALESALYAYGLVMRYTGWNNVSFYSLRNMPRMGAYEVDDIDYREPVFEAGAERELTPAVKRIEETVEYKLTDSKSAPMAKSIKFTGAKSSIPYKYRNSLGETSTKNADVWPIVNTSGFGWGNGNDSPPLYFNPSAYPCEQSIKDDAQSSIYLATNTDQSGASWYAQMFKGKRFSFTLSFGRLIMRDISIASKPTVFPIMLSSLTVKKVKVSIAATSNGVTSYLNEEGKWQTDGVILEVPIDEETMQASKTVFLDSFAQVTSLVLIGIHDITLGGREGQDWYDPSKGGGVYVAVKSLSFAEVQGDALCETNRVNTNYDVTNNVILSREPKIAPALNDVLFPSIIQNGIFVKSGTQYLPAKLWYWGGQTPQQMAVYNHLQLLCYHAKPNNVLRGTIVNADVTDMQVIWLWHGAEHMFVSGSFNLLSGHIENAVLREFARYEDMWGMLDPADLPDVDGKSVTNVESGSASKSEGARNTINTEVYLGGGNIVLDDYMSDESENGVMNRVIKAYIDNLWHLDENGNLVTDKQVIIKNSLIVEQDTSSGGEGEDTPSGGISGVKVNGVTYYDDNGDGIVDLGTISGGGGVSGDYLPLSGGTLLGGLQIGSDNNTSYLDIGVKRNNVYTYMATTGAGEGYIGADFANGNYAGITIIDSPDTLYYSHNGVYKNIIHSGNIGNYALPLSGGTIDGSVRRPLTINTTYSLGAILPLCHKSSEVAAFGHIPKSATSIYGTFLVNSEAKIGLLLSHDGVAYLTKDSDSLTKDYTLIHSGNVGSYAMRWMGGANTGADVNSFSFAAGAYGVASALNSPTSTGYGAVLNIPYRVGHRNAPDYMGQIYIPNGDDADRSIFYRTSLAETWQPWRRIVSEDDNGNVTLYGTHLFAKNYVFMNSGGEGIYLSTDAISWHNAGNAWVRDIVVFASSGNVGIGITSPSTKLDVNGTIRSKGIIINRTTDNAQAYFITEGSSESLEIRTAGGSVPIVFNTNYNGAGERMRIAGNGNVGIGTTEPQFELDVKGGIRATKPIFGYIYGTHNNAAAFIFDKPGSNYTGIGSDGVSDTIRFGACNVQGGWVDYNQKWKFYGDIIVTGDVASA